MSTKTCDKSVSSDRCPKCMECIGESCDCIGVTCAWFWVIVWYTFLVILAIACVLLCVLALTFLAVLIIDVFSYLVTHGEFGCTAFWFCT